MLSFLAAMALAAVGTIVLISNSDQIKLSFRPSSPLRRHRRELKLSWSSPQFVDPKSVKLRIGTKIDTDVYSECIRHVESDRLPALVAALSENPEANGITPIDLGGDPVEHISGLDLNVFRGRRIAIMGDSTLYYPTKWLYAMLTKLKGDNIDGPEYDQMTLSEGAALAMQRADQLGVDFGKGHPIPIRASDGTSIEWMGVAGSTSGKMKQKMKLMFQKAEGMKPEVIVANFGLHWLHLCGFKRCPSEEDGDGPLVINYWANYRRDWLRRVYDMAVRVDAKLLLFKTSNFVCDEKRTNEWATWSAKYLSFDGKTIEDCYAQNAKYSDSDGIPLDQIYGYCKYGQFTEMGVEYLNNQIMDFVREVHETNVDSSLTVGIFRDHDVEGCDDTEDSIHHHSSILMRLRLLSNTIESYSECAAPSRLHAHGDDGLLDPRKEKKQRREKEEKRRRERREDDGKEKDKRS